MCLSWKALINEWETRRNVWKQARLLFAQTNKYPISLLLLIQYVLNSTESAILGPHIGALKAEIYVIWNFLELMQKNND